jgi:hypothetical protein
LRKYRGGPGNDCCRLIAVAQIGGACLKRQSQSIGPRSQLKLHFSICHIDGQRQIQAPDSEVEKKLSNKSHIWFICFI